MLLNEFLKKAPDTSGTAINDHGAKRYGGAAAETN
jgi:hypothetical protein